MADETKLSKQFEVRRRELGMSRALLAKRARVSLPTVNRILGGQLEKASFANVVAIAKELGIELRMHFACAPAKMRKTQAERKARRLVRLVQGTSALEGQGLDQKELEAMISRTSADLLASKRKLWID